MALAVGNNYSPKLCFLANANSAHTAKWCNWFSENGFDVTLVSVHACSADAMDRYSDRISVHIIQTTANEGMNDWQKLAYLGAAKELHAFLSDLKPDVVHAHFATSYGLIAALGCAQPYYLSVWGYDVYDFPRKSPLHKFALEYSLRKASALFSTSKAMAEEASRYTDKNMAITPFGVDMSLFRPSSKKGDRPSIAIVKTLEKKYGIGTLIRAFALVSEANGCEDYVLRIAGTGSLEGELKSLANKLGVADKVEGLGFVSQKDAAEVYRRAEIAVIPSESESFGVSAVEAQACGIPIIVSDIPGLMEATLPGKSSLVFQRGDCEGLASQILVLLRDSKKRREMGACGLRYVAEHFELNACFERVKARYLRDLEAKQGHSGGYWVGDSAAVADEGKKDAAR